MTKSPQRTRWRSFDGEEVVVEGPIACSFCGRPEDEQRMIIAVPTPGVAICEDCVRQAAHMFSEESRPGQE
jgi:hypothetical protein